LKNLEMIEKFEKSGSNNKEASDDAWKSFESYRKDTFLPKEVKDNRIYVDKRSETIILPIYGLAVPFHISTVKNASKSDEGEFFYLRINLNSPGQVIGKKDQTNASTKPRFPLPHLPSNSLVAISKPGCDICEILYF
jgi:nucleosome binding factor SPN SPT16 subunit